MPKLIQPLYPSYEFESELESLQAATLTAVQLMKIQTMAAAACEAILCLRVEGEMTLESFQKEHAYLTGQKDAYTQIIQDHLEATRITTT